MTVFERVCGVLNDSGIAHALIGASALAARGVARSTYDIDLLTTDGQVLEPGLWQSLSSDGLRIDIRRGDADDPLGGVVRVETADERPVDVILGKLAWQQRAVERAELVAGGPPVVLARDLVLLKLYAGGPQDLWDVRELLRQPERVQLASDVTADLAELPSEMRERWQSLRA
ncbi:MAG: hypothetical protein WC815_06230 [Vicinamibacterales bacterium]|jgi:hypothetical protein